MCEYLEIEMMASIINDQAFDLVSELDLNRLKIASRTVKENPELCKKIISTKKQVFCSLGFVDNDINFFKEKYDNVRYINTDNNLQTVLVEGEKIFTSGYSLIKSRTGWKRRL